MADPRQLFFLHVPKTAGTSMVQFLKDAAGDGAVHFEGRAPRQIDDIPARELRGFRVVGGHIPFHFAHWGFTRRKNALPRFGRAVWRPGRVYLAVLRDPVDMVISLHRYVQRRDGHAWATRGSLAEALRDREKFARSAQNLQCYYLSGRRNARSALKTISRHPYIVGTIDRLDLIEEALNAYFETEIEMARLNTAPTPIDWDIYGPIRSEIAAITEEDQVLFESIRAKGIHLNL